MDQWVTVSDSEWEPVTQDQVGDLIDRTEAALGGFAPAYDTCPPFRNLLGAARGCLGQRRAYDALVAHLDGQR